MSLICSQATQTLRCAIERETDSRIVLKFDVGELVLVFLGELLKKDGIWPAFQSIFYGPCRIVGASHPRYELIWSTDKCTRNPANARRLVRYHSRPY